MRKGWMGVNQGGSLWAERLRLPRIRGLDHSLWSYHAATGHPVSADYKVQDTETDKGGQGRCLWSTLGGKVVYQ